MEGFNVTPTMFFAVLELALVLFLIAAGFIVRSTMLAGKIAALQHRASRKKQPPAVEAVSFQQQLQNEVVSNRALIEQTGEPQPQTAGLLQLRGRFLELEAGAQGLVGHPENFREKILAGISELLDELRAQAGEEPAADDDRPARPAVPSNPPAGRYTIDTQQAELESLKQVINNQQDALKALREELCSRAGNVDAQEPGTVTSRTDTGDDDGK